ncbi:MAG: membrane dipeptidase, partial [Acidobacteriaceae bacterium]|nr:membrane dipeptidase [Acidobacteriaceae bacterium]
MFSQSSVVALLASAALFAGPPAGKKLDSQVERIRKAAILIDTHNDIPSFTVSGTDIQSAPKNHTDLPRLRQGGVGAVFFSVYVAATYVEGNRSANRALQMIDTVQHDIIDRYPNDFLQAF